MENDFCSQLGTRTHVHLKSGSVGFNRFDDIILGSHAYLVQILTRLGYEFDSQIELSFIIMLSRTKMSIYLIYNDELITTKSDLI